MKHLVLVVVCACGGSAVQPLEIAQQPGAAAVSWVGAAFDPCPGATKVLDEPMCATTGVEDGGTLVMNIDWNDCTPGYYRECDCADGGEIIMRKDWLPDAAFCETIKELWLSVCKP